MGFNLEDYETVEERLIKFWKEHPDGRIETELIEATSTRFIVVARIFRTMESQKQEKLFQKKEDQMFCKKFSKTRITIPEPFFSDPFNMTGERDADKDNKRKHKRARNVQKAVAAA